MKTQIKHIITQLIVFGIVLLLASVTISCKKIKISTPKQPESIQLCIIDTIHPYNGKYITNDRDTIIFKYINSECKNRNLQNYKVSNLKAAFATRKFYRVEDSDYIIRMNLNHNAFEGGILQMVPWRNETDSIFLLSLALKDSTYTLGITKLK